MRLNIQKLACLTGLVLLTACTRNGSATPPASTQNPPLYPGARHVFTETVEGLKYIPATRISFEVDADNDAIVAFYENALAKDGWQPRTQQTPNELHFSWLEGCPNYGLDIITTPKS